MSKCWPSIYIVTSCKPVLEFTKSSEIQAMAQPGMDKGEEAAEARSLILLQPLRLPLSPHLAERMAGELIQQELLRR